MRTKTTCQVNKFQNDLAMRSLKKLDSRFNIGNMKGNYLLCASLCAGDYRRARSFRMSMPRLMVSSVAA